MFKDHVTITVQGGKGGDGVVSFRREKYVPRGGPDGGDGGRGGDVKIQIEKNLRTLNDFRENQVCAAENGTAGRRKKQHGKAGKDLILNVPLGTVVYEVTGTEKKLLADLSEKNDCLCAAKGGKGGLGNIHFTTSTNQAPRVADLGEHGEKKTIFLELKVIADLGIIGLPNAGKSTLLAALTAARPKIAPYAFTTLQPNLGILVIESATDARERLVLVDIPGLIEGASKNKGLGHTFLRHIERTTLLLHLIDCTSNNFSEIKKDYTTINQELKKFSSTLAQKKQIIVFNKIDELTTAQVAKLKKAVSKTFSRIPYCFISAEYQEGLPKLKELIWHTFYTYKQQIFLPSTPQKIFRPLEKSSQEFVITHKQGIWYISGKTVEKIVQKTRLESEESLQRMFELLKKTGLIQALENKGVQPSDTVQIAGYVFTWE